MKKRTASGKGISRLSIALVVVLVLLIAACVPMFNYITSGMVNDIAVSINQQYSRELNQQMSAHIAGALEYPFQRLEMLRCSLQMMDRMTGEKLMTFISRQEQANNIPYLAFVTEDGNVYEAKGYYLGTTRIKMLGKLLSGEKHIISDNETIAGNSFVLMGTAFDTPIPMGDTNICAAIIGMTNDELSREIVLNNQFASGYSSIIHRNGSYIVKNRATPFSGLNVFSIIEKNYSHTDEEISRLKNAVSSGEPYAITATQEGDDTFSFLYFAPVEGTEWYIVNTMPGTFIKSSVAKLQDSLTKLSVLGIVIIMAMIVILLQTISGAKMRKNQQELETAYAMAEQANEAKTEFLFSMSHDIRTPMNAILGYSRLVKK
ncbi:MAG: hypothetical protein Q4C54_06125 [Clostridia bacterium]|nr:hypothetical protein [Clostridia bacterium]